MTRINCVPVEELTGKHLVAEYRELPRLFNLIADWKARGRPGDIPETYRLGAGHVRFFYTKEAWLATRFDQLVNEMLRRGYQPQYLSQWHRVQDEEPQLWVPDEVALVANRARIAERLAG